MHRLPLSTYRIQFQQHFTFQDLKQVLPYFQQLGIDTLYASPILRAKSGSTHGYDTVSFDEINPEIGNLQHFKHIRKQLKTMNVKWLQDIVPNHMAFHEENNWLWDLLEFGRNSSYRNHFDNVYSDDQFFVEGKLIVPILTDRLSNILAKNELHIIQEKNRLLLTYLDNKIPLCPTSYALVFTNFFKQLSESSLLSYTQIKFSNSFSPRQWLALRNHLFGLLSPLEEEKKLPAYLSLLSQNQTFMTEILSLQHYQLCCWQETDTHINFRRFFTVNALVCTNVQHKNVFSDIHKGVKTMLDNDLIDGLRIDHIDGLYRPTKYLNDLRKLVGNELYIVAEKILESKEKLQAHWPIQGTTGYEFLSTCSNLLTHRASKNQFSIYYHEFLKQHIDIGKQQLQKKKHILKEHMQGEVQNLGTLFYNLNLYTKKKPLQQKRLSYAILSFLTYFPIYRIYSESFPYTLQDYQLISELWTTLIKNESDYEFELKALQGVFEKAQKETDPEYRQRAAKFFLRCMQFTGPAMAKGVEDTLMYTYNRFIAHNEVGDHPTNFGLKKNAFHRFMQDRQNYWPAALNATATHDTKRGEDARARLLVLSDRPKLWKKYVDQWNALISTHYKEQLPYANDIYAIYQVLLGSFPMPTTSEVNFQDRLQDYLIKYLREGKEYSNWTTPNETYEMQVMKFCTFLLDQNKPFLSHFRSFLTEIVDFGIINSLVQVILKFTCPGIPDVYQGTELWDLNFVDPDNRRAVDYQIRSEYINQLNVLQEHRAFESLWEERYNGKIKLQLVRKLFQLRNQFPDLFEKGDYIKIEVKGKYKKHILAYARRHENNYLVIALPLHLAATEKMHNGDMTNLDWEDTEIILPVKDPVNWKRLYFEETGQGTSVSCNEILKDLPFALLLFDQPPVTRDAGILLHISSLPAVYGIGDLGKQAFKFATSLKQAGQRWWQILPLGPLSREQSYSPYSTLSSRAGNPLLIDLAQLKDEGLLCSEELLEAKNLPQSYVDYPKVESNREKLLKIAFERSSIDNNSTFHNFCTEERAWLDDFSLFMVLRKHFANLPWYSWSSKFRDRDDASITKFSTENTYAITYEKWQQYLFFQQWNKLKNYCHSIGIQLLGDIPIYVAYDAVDVWSNPELFSLTAEGRLKEVAGVPPDYFNTAGQLWGMPVYHWQRMKENGYNWWVKRVQHNLQLVDKIRLDHFRAFSAYWSNPSTAENAIQGKWITGPGAAIFETLKTALKSLPFVAEDLGDVDDDVYTLRDLYELPGMKVLQFAFNSNLAISPHIIHHHERRYIVYTGTHDNNTSKGWFEKELDLETREQIRAYFGCKLTKKNIADKMIRMAYASVADTAIIPMQDILSLGSKSRMNTPSTTEGNWVWRMPTRAFTKHHIRRLKHYTQLFNR
ncbi:malto-oligosyltrehalose synthase [Sphingobacterium sp. LRF_L2]|uniref:malto-oligosyltrehalose synthase n=1 Tax=Sphingobacterium sp. LRF_L2 TaxID=3369421 RepID=UPI003F600A49